MPNANDDDELYPGSITYHPVRRSDLWGSLPGNYDVTRGRVHWPTDGNPWGIPTIQKGALLPEQLRQYKSNDRRDPRPGEGLHFCTDDYAFEHLWTRAKATLGTVQKFGRALSPDFSVFAEWPAVVQAYQVYRNRWLGAYWQSERIEVTPMVNWGLPNTWDFCFAGLEPGTSLAICSAKVRTAQEHIDNWRAGLLELVHRIAPPTVLLIGNPLWLPRLPSDVEVRAFARTNKICERPSGVARWYSVVAQPNGRLALFDVERAKFLRMRCTPEGILRQLSAWMPPDNARALISGEGCPVEYRTWAECLERVEQQHGITARVDAEELGD